MCLAVTCRLHVWQNDRDLLRAAAVTQGWNGYRNEASVHKGELGRLSDIVTHCQMASAGVGSVRHQTENTYAWLDPSRAPGPVVHLL